MAHPPLETGRPAPAFRLPDQERRGQSLSDYRGKRVVLHFFPMDDSAKTVALVERFNELRSALEATRAEVLLITVNECGDAAEFAEAHGLYFPILCDDGQVAKAYGARGGFGPLKFTRRLSVLVDADGDVEQVFRAVRGPEHVDELLTALGK